MSEQRRRTELRQRLLDDYPTLPAAVVLAAVTEAERAVTLFGNSANNALEQALRHNLTAVQASSTAQEAHRRRQGSRWSWPPRPRRK